MYRFSICNVLRPVIAAISVLVNEEKRRWVAYFVVRISSSITC